MKRKLFLALIYLIIISSHAFASHSAGGEITYKYVGNNKYDVTFKYYRDCRGGASNNLNFYLLCPATSASVNLATTLTGIRDISSTCATGVKCQPSNTSISSGSPIFEEHTYATTLDFNGALSSFKNCCTLKLGMGECCRTGSITTGAAGNDFWVTNTLELCKVSNNSSPEFAFPPTFVSSCNQSTYWNFSARDTVDNDSLSYSFTDPLTSWYGKTSWASGFSSKSPFSVYWPSGYDKSKGPRPDANPPIGVYLDPQRGTLVFAPTNCSEVSVMAVSVKEWRKDSSGKYQQIGEIIRDIQFVVSTSPLNNSPSITSPLTFTICEGVMNYIDIVTNDKVYNPPPPFKSNPPDSTSIEWDHGISGAHFKYVSDTARLKVGRFSWIPLSGSSRKNPYYFNVKVKDNACPLNSVIYRTIAVYVKPNIILNHKLTKIDDHTFVGKGGPDSTYKGTYSNIWNVLDSSGKSFSKLPGYSPLLYYKIKSNGSLHSSDTISFRKNGKYIIAHYLNAGNYCPKVVFDTVILTNISPLVTLGTTSDTVVCDKKSIRFTAKVSNGQKPFIYTWKVRGIYKTDTLSYFDHISNLDDTIEVEVRDAMNHINSSMIKIGSIYKLPNFKLANNTIKCPGLSLLLQGLPLTKFENIKSWVWKSNGVTIGNTDSIRVKNSGLYVLMAENTSLCQRFDTVKVTEFPKTKFQLSNGTYCQDKGKVSQNELILQGSDWLKKDKFDWKLIKSIKNNSGNDNTLNDLLIDEDTSASFKFAFLIDKSRIDLRTSKVDSFSISLNIIDSFGCFYSDTARISIIKNPSITLVANPINICRNSSLDLNLKLTSDGDVKWFAFNSPDYDIWPNSGIINSGIINEKYFNEAGGKYLVNIISDFKGCMNFDSLALIVTPNPIPVVTYQAIGDNIQFTDNSLYAISRIWYLDNVSSGSSNIISFSKSTINGKAVHLVLKNGTCMSDTTFTLNTLSVTQFESEAIKIYPNPAFNYLTVKQLKEAIEAKYKIYNLLGELILEGELHEIQTDINIENFSNGLYCIKILSKKLSYSYPFMKRDY